VSSSRTKLIGSFAAGMLLGLAGIALYYQQQELNARAEKALEKAQEPEQVPRAELVEQVRQGGYILYFRHAQRQKWDSVIAFDVYEIATGMDGNGASFKNAVCLTPQGIEEAKMIGEIFRLARIPAGHVLASPSCRARQTAMFAFGHIDSISNSLAHTPVVNPRNTAAFSAELKRVLTTVPILPGTNTIVAAHNNTLDYNLDIFASGTKLINKSVLLETGFYVIRRDSDLSLHVVQRFNELGQLASSFIDLDPAAQSTFLNAATPVAASAASAQDR
jgi:phosphohistidine phosphatase SixA